MFFCVFYVQAVILAIVALNNVHCVLNLHVFNGYENSETGVLSVNVFGKNEQTGYKNVSWCLCVYLCRLKKLIPESEWLRK